MLITCFITGCGTSHKESEVEAAMKRYDDLIVRMDADSLALLFEPDGELGEMAKGRDSIRRFLQSFTNVKVLSNLSTSESVELNADSAVQKGHYSQIAVINNRDTLKPTGAYTGHWHWSPDQGWLIRKMETNPGK